MPYRPYPNRDRALNQLDRGRPRRQPSEFELRLAAQANAALAAAGRSLEPLARSIRENTAANRPLLVDLLAVAGPRLVTELGQSTPGVLIMQRMADQMRRRA